MEQLYKETIPMMMELDEESSVCETTEPNYTCIKDILESKIVPNKYFVKVKVVDHQPARLQDFTMPKCIDCQKCNIVVRDDVYFCLDCQKNDTCFLWYMFSFLITDGTGYLPLLINGREAVRCY
jgi:hypothetical protein